MIKKNKFMLITTSIVMLIPIVIGVILWSKLPNPMATHFGFNNEPNGWSSKPFTVFGIPMIILALHWLCIILTNTDKRYKNIDPKLQMILFWICPAVSLLCTTVIYGFALEIEMNVGFIVNLFLGILFILIGNYLPKCKQNNVLGMRIKWTLDSADNWYHTHRCAGWCMTIGGIIILIVAFFEDNWLVFPVVALSIIIPIIYSYVYYKKNSK